MKLRIRRIVIAVGVAILLMAGVGVWLWPRPLEHSIDYKMPGNPAPKIAAGQAAVIERRERVIAQTVWRKELEAQEHGRVFEDFWDALNGATNAGSKWEVVEKLSFGEIALVEGRMKESLPHGIERWVPAKGEKLESPHVDSYEGWIGKVGEWKAAGWGILQCEFRHNAFDPQTNEAAAKSRVYFSVHLTNATPARAVVEGDLFVEWAARATNQAPAVARINATALKVLSREGAPAFTRILHESSEPPDLSVSIEPLLVYNLDDDAIPEIVLPALNRLYRWIDGRYVAEKFCSTERVQVLNGVFTDFDRDGVTDFLYVEFDGIFLLKGAPRGKFQVAPRALSEKFEDFFGPRVITCADIDGDGDLDVFIGQYKGPFTGGSMPTPYYDAIDGYPWHLFVNDGSGKLIERTRESGLASKRFRRVYAASFVDLDGDGALDLTVTSDFAGVDIFRGDGSARFRDVTEEWLPERHAFGMGHAFADFNADGKLDFYVTGMTSATADRLEHFGLQRAHSKFDSAMRARMSVGSRLYLAGDGSARRFTEGRRGSARTGWSWGAAAADFDNDGQVDLYIANGMETMTKVRDYEQELWLHDMFVGDSTERAVEKLYFSLKGAERRRRWESFGGFDKNRLLLNRGDAEFVDVAHLLGVALEDDCRNLVATDLDDDGDVDLAMISAHAGMKPHERVHVFRNDLPRAGNWIAFDLREERGRSSPIGAQVILSTGGVKRIAAIVNGDSFRAQHPTTVRFGLGSADRAEGAEIRWPGGAVTRIAGPEINRSHQIRPPALRKR